MTVKTKLGMDLTRAVAAAVVLALVAAVGLYFLLRDSNERRFTMMFTGTVGLYEGNDVRVLGVKVGTVDRVIPQGQTVRVDVLVDRDVHIPAGANAIIVAPSLVSDRYVQLAPAFTGGPEMTDGTVLPTDRTATPLEVDDLYNSLIRVTDTLGPNGANKDGALSDLLNTLADNAGGNGQALHDTITQLSQAANTLSGNKDNLFGTVDKLSQFTTTLAQSDQTVNQFSAQLADASNFLAGERQNLGKAVQQLAGALAMVQQFIKDNRGRLKSNVDKLSTITQVLVDQRAALAETLDLAPLALGNVQNAYNAASGTLDARADINELTSPPIVAVCDLVDQLANDKLPKQLLSLCGTISKAVPIPTGAQVINALQQGTLPTLPFPLIVNSVGGN
ncbi:MCE family protein [Labedaea rhizosphaerae]|uniref:Virulence factor Mce-like protein n=1 Tax=Labedaea rhizosphaerae TaxID=598644 RepID=A0A4R6SQA4_LABRH|nr:MCE family protein [Labedaea rhizosphaerae]TDQ05712.1 virulence factor Mce-like protein [Labedaea rhizosphaerae]